VARARSVPGRLVLLLLASATVLHAQADTTVHRPPLAVAALRPGIFVYETSLERDASTTPLGTRTVNVSQSPIAGSPAWLLLETRTGDAVPGADSLYVDPTTLRPMHWSSTIGQAKLAAEFQGDTVYAGASAPQGRRSVIGAVPPRTIVSTAMLETVLRLLPLQPAWEDSATTLSLSLSGLALYPTRIAVIGEDRVHVGAGDFDCWVVSVHTEVSRGLFWVTKQDPIVVRSTLDVPSLGGAQYVSSLARIAR
jgi:hypothetical protein